MTSDSTTNEADLSLDEMLGILDVASTLRRERAEVNEQFSLEQTKSGLRERLLAASEASGEKLTGEQVDAAIERYYDNLHEFRPPPWGMGVMLAHLYVRRMPVGLVATGLLVTGLVLWWL